MTAILQSNLETDLRLASSLAANLRVLLADQASLRTSGVDCLPWLASTARSPTPSRSGSRAWTATTLSRLPPPRRATSRPR